MKLFIAIDREGVSGVVAEHDAGRAGAAAEAAIRRMRGDLDAVLQGCCTAGATEVVVCDAHDDGRSLASEGLPPGVVLVGGSPAPHSMMQGIGSGFDGALFVGYHARAGVAGAVLEHTWNYRVYAVTVGGAEVGEFGIGALLAGHFGVPAVYASGDDKLAAEAQALVPAIVTTVVKRGITRHAARLLPPEECQARMRDDVVRALRSGDLPRPLQWDGSPMRLTFTRVEYCDQASFCPGVRRLDGRSIEIPGATFEEVYRSFLACLMLSELPG